MIHLKLIVIAAIVSITYNSKKPTAIQNTVIERPQSTLNAYCFYKFDNKYGVSHDSLDINKWKKIKTKQIQNDTIEGDIFMHRGGGPFGAEWNPSADLYIAILPAADMTGRLVVNINDKPFTTINITGNELKWIVIKQDVWEKKLRKVKKRDSDPDKMSEYAPSDMVGQIIRIEFVLGKNKLVKYFYAAFSYC